MMLFVACTQEEVNKVMDSAKSAQKSWAKTPLWKRAELLHKAAAILKEHKSPIAECLVKEIAKPAKDSVTEVWILVCFLADYWTNMIVCKKTGKLNWKITGYYLLILLII